ncbi:trans-sialidase, putative, partial [Trypanosoma cruzi marinkellei]
MVSVLLTAQLQQVKEVLKTWKKVDERVSELCPSESSQKDALPENPRSANVKITDGLVGFLSDNFSGNTWRDEYLGVNATVQENGGAQKADNGVKFTGRGAGAEWPVGRQGEKSAVPLCELQIHSCGDGVHRRCAEGGRSYSE